MAGCEFAVPSSSVQELSSQIKADGASLYAVLVENPSSVVIGRVFPVPRVHQSLEGLYCIQITRGRPFGSFELLATQSTVLSHAIAESLAGAPWKR